MGNDRRSRRADRGGIPIAPAAGLVAGIAAVGSAGPATGRILAACGPFPPAPPAAGACWLAALAPSGTATVLLLLLVLGLGLAAGLLLAGRVRRWRVAAGRARAAAAAGSGPIASAGEDRGLAVLPPPGCDHPWAEPTCEVAGELTALRAENEALGRLSRVQGELMAVASHEFKTPLTSISAYTDVLLDRVGTCDFPQSEEFLGVIKSETERLLRMTDRILDLSRLEIGGQLLDRHVVDLGPLLRDTARAMAPLFARKGMTLDVSCPSDLPRVEIDPDLIRQALINLVNNALKYAHAGGAVRVRVVEDAAMVRLSVSDDGPGIPPEELGRIFRQFYRLESAGGEEGSGLGLAIVKSIVALHDGQVEVESRPGEGATFSLHLPKELRVTVAQTELLGERVRDQVVQRMLQLCLRTTADLLAVRRAALLLRDPEGRARPVMALGAATGDRHGLVDAALAGQGVLAEADRREGAWEAAVPLRAGGRRVGALAAAGRLDGRPLDADDLDHLSTLAEGIGVALEVAGKSGDARSLAGVVEALQAMARLRRSDVPTATPLALRLLGLTARRLGLGGGETRRLQYVASLHDAGMTAVSEEIVQKVGRLSEDERLEVERHPEEGARLVAPLLSRPEMERIITAHHERMDGSGYPQGLPGGEIPLGSRILSVVDAFFAMVRRRPYRRPLPPERVEAEIRRHAGTQFDPRVVDAFLAVLREEGMLSPPEAGGAAAPEPQGAAAGPGDPSPLKEQR